jgi:hypothetical protein
MTSTVLLQRFSALALLLVCFSGCDALMGKSKPMPTSWPLAPFKLASTTQITEVTDSPDAKLWALWMNTRGQGAPPQKQLSQILVKQGYKDTPRLPADKRDYLFLMISPDNQYYAMLAKGNDGSYPSPTTNKAQYVFEIVSVQHHRMRLGL